MLLQKRKIQYFLLLHTVLLGCYEKYDFSFSFEGNILTAGFNKMCFYKGIYCPLCVSLLLAKKSTPVWVQEHFTQCSSPFQQTQAGSRSPTYHHRERDTTVQISFVSSRSSCLYEEHTSSRIQVQPNLFLSHGKISMIYNKWNSFSKCKGPCLSVDSFTELLNIYVVKACADYMVKQMPIFTVTVSCNVIKNATNMLIIC